MFDKRSVAILIISFVFFNILYFFNMEKEGDSINIYSSRKESLVQELFKEFTKTTGVKVNFIHDSDPGKLIARIKNEGKKTDADLFMTADVANLIMAKRSDLLLPVESMSLNDNIPVNLRDKDNYWFGVTKRARIIVYSKSRVTDFEELKDYEDLTDSRWKGRLLMRSSNSVYNQSLLASIIASEGEEKAALWVRGIVSNLARKPYGGDTDQIKAVAAGEGDVTISNSYYYARLFSAKKDTSINNKHETEVVFPNQKNRGTHVNISGIALVKHAKHADNAIRFMEFLVSPKAQHMYAEINQEFPVVKGVEPSEYLKSWGNFKQDAISLDAIEENLSKAIEIMDKYKWR